MREYITHIGVEVHVELNTKTKAFCSCRNEFGAMPNTLVCPVCYGLPGGVPSLNRQAVELTIKSGMLLNGDISREFSFERKNFFSADMPKGYQLVQYSMPICKGGYVELYNDKKIQLNRIHLEEDSGKFVYGEDKKLLYVDYNRSGVPVLEIVSDPVVMTADEVNEYLYKLRRILMFGGISECRMQEGGFRFDINLSLTPKDSSGLGTRVELKNLNSSRSVRSAIDYEIQRQISVLESGNMVAMETRVWDEEMQKTYVVRPKETLEDYRHFRDPDFKAVSVSDKDLTRLRDELPESFDDRCSRYLRLGFTGEQINLLTTEKAIADFFDETLSLVSEPQEIYNWIATELLRVYKDQNRVNFSSIMTPEDLSTIISLLKDEKISRVNAKALFDEVVTTGKSAQTLSKEMSVIGTVNDEEIVEIIESIITSQPQIIEDFRQGSENVINYFIGNILSQTAGKSDPEKIKSILFNKLKQ